MEGLVVVNALKIIVNQTGTALFTVSGNQLFNISKAEVKGTELYSVGVENLSFGLYKKEKRAMTALNSLLAFLSDETRSTFRFEPDKV
jgi:hypothetical protein